MLGSQSVERNSANITKKSGQIFKQNYDTRLSTLSKHLTEVQLAKGHYTKYQSTSLSLMCVKKMQNK